MRMINLHQDPNEKVFYSDAVEAGAVWTTDAPFRETEEAIAAAKRARLLAVEMETAALYAFAAARRLPVLCLAHVTNCMAKSEGDFEKGEADGSVAVLVLLGRIAAEWRRRGGRLWVGGAVRGGPARPEG